MAGYTFSFGKASIQISGKPASAQAILPSTVQYMSQNQATATSLIDERTEAFFASPYTQDVKPGLYNMTDSSIPNMVRVMSNLLFIDPALIIDKKNLPWVESF